MRRLGLKRSLLLTFALTLCVATLMFTLLMGGGVGAPRRASTKSGFGQPAGRSTQGTRSFEQPAGQVHWTISRYDSPKGPCIEVVAEEVGGSHQGRLGGCGRPENPSLRWSIGGIDMDGQWFNVAYGAVSAAAASVRVTRGDQRELTDAGVRGGQGLWIVVIAGNPLDGATDIVQIVARDESGHVIASIRPPSIVAYRQQAASSG